MGRVSGSGRVPVGMLQFRQHFIDDITKLIVKAYGVRPVNPSDDIRATAQISVIPFTPLNPLVVSITRSHLLTSSTARPTCCRFRAAPCRTRPQPGSPETELSEARCGRPLSTCQRVRGGPLTDIAKGAWRPLTASSHCRPHALSGTGHGAFTSSNNKARRPNRRRRFRSRHGPHPHSTLAVRHAPPVRHR